MKSYQSILESVQPAKLVAISKRKPVEAVLDIYQQGQRVFGENQVQELLPKIDQLPKDIEWHFVGKLQKNKVNKIVGRVALIHSVDSLALAEKINLRAETLGAKQAVLIQLNISGEESKSGFSEAELYESFEQLATMQHIDINGL